MVTSPGTINGGFYPRSPEGPQHPSVVIAVGDVGAAMRNVTDAGGAVIADPVKIPGIGQYVSFHRHRGQPGEPAAALPPLTTSLRDRPGNRPLTAGR